MATLSSQPNNWNLAYAPNVFTLGTLGSADRFVLRVVIDGAIVATFKQPSNPSGVAHFDVSKVLQSYLKPTYIENTVELSETPDAVISYQVYYGSETNGVYLQDGASAIKHALNGYTNWRVKDWDYVDYIPNPSDLACLCEVPPCYTDAIYSRTYEYLTNWPTTNASGIKKYKVRSDEYKTLSFFNRILEWNDGTMWGPNESPFFVKYTYYNAAGSILATDIKTISAGTGIGVRTDCQDYTTHAHTDAELIGTVAVGPQNIKDGSFYWANGTAYYTVELYSINACYLTDNGPIGDCDDIGELADYLGFPIYQAEFHIDDYCQKFEPITVSFMNAFGVKDYYTFSKRNTHTTQVTRNNYKQQLGSWNESTWNIDETGRGRTTFSTMATTQMTLQSDWMTDEESKWLEELFTSPSANIYINGAWEPVIILSTEYQQMTSARNGMFQHEVTIQFANDKNIQRG